MNLTKKELIIIADIMEALEYGDKIGSKIYNEKTIPWKEWNKLENRIIKKLFKELKIKALYK